MKMEIYKCNAYCFDVIEWVISALVVINGNRCWAQVRQAIECERGEYHERDRIEREVKVDDSDSAGYNRIRKALEHKQYTHTQYTLTPNL